MKTSGFSNIDPNLAAQQAMWNAASGYQKDLGEAAQKLQENSRMKEALRALQPFIDSLESAIEANFDGTGSSQQMQDALTALRNELRDLGFDESDPIFQATIAPDADVDADGLKVLGTGTFGAINEELAEFTSGIEDAVQNEMDNQGDIGDWLQLRLQMAQNGHKRTSDSVSNILKANHDAASTAIGNIR